MTNKTPNPKQKRDPKNTEKEPAALLLKGSDGLDYIHVKHTLQKGPKNQTTPGLYKVVYIDKGKKTEVQLIQVTPKEREQLGLQQQVPVYNPQFNADEYFSIKSNNYHQIYETVKHQAEEAAAKAANAGLKAANKGKTADAVDQDDLATEKIAMSEFISELIGNSKYLNDAYLFNQAILDYYSNEITNAAKDKDATTEDKAREVKRANDILGHANKCCDEAVTTREQQYESQAAKEGKALFSYAMLQGEGRGHTGRLTRAKNTTTERQ